MEGDAEGGGVGCYTTPSSGGWLLLMVFNVLDVLDAPDDCA